MIKNIFTKYKSIAIMDYVNNIMYKRKEEKAMSMIQTIMQRLNIDTNTEPIVLSSAEPINDGGRNLNKIYTVSVIICSVIGAISGGGFGGIFCLAIVGLILGWAIKNRVCETLILTARLKRFHLDKEVPYSELINQLIPIMSPLGAMIEKSEEGSPVISYQGEIYDVRYNDDNTFKIWWRRNVVKAVLMVDNITAYRKESVAMGIIGYHVQRICSNKFSERSSVETTVAPADNIVPVQNKTKKFCTKCGASIDLSAKFCKECGTKI